MPFTVSITRTGKNGFANDIEKLASVLGMDVLTYAIISNHLHLVLRGRPDVVTAWATAKPSHPPFAKKHS